MLHYRHFDFSEFDCPLSEANSGMRFMDREFMEMLDEARDIARLKFVILKGYVSKEWINLYGGVTTSPHLVGRAAHIKCKNPSKRRIIIGSLLQVGFTRIGINRKYIHVDNDDLKRNGIWIIP